MLHNASFASRDAATVTEQQRAADRATAAERKRQLARFPPWPRLARARFGPRSLERADTYSR